MRLSWAGADHAACRLLQEWGYPADDARYIAQHLLTCDALGLAGLGLARLSLIREILDAGAPVGDPTEVVHSTSTTRSFTGGGGIGYLTTRAGLAWALQRLDEQTPLVAFTANRFFLNGALRIYARQAAERGYICVLASSGAPAAVAPFGGTIPVLGTNPLCIAVPGAPDPVVVDVSTSTTTWSDVRRAAAEQLPLDDDVAIDRGGRPTCDPAEALHGALLPRGGPLGYALGVAVQCLGILAGAPATPRSMTDCGLVGVFLDAAAFSGETPLAAVEDLRGAVAAAGPAKAGLRLPGQRWSQRLRVAEQRGLAVDDTTAALLRPFMGSDALPEITDRDWRS